jgi:HK97 gp10 family phage protein
MTKLDVKIDGIDGLVQKLRKLDRKIQRKTARSALGRSGTVLKNEIILQAEKFFSKGYVTGNLASSVESRPMTRRDGLKTGEQGQKVGVTRRAFYWRFLEFGEGNIRPPRPFMRTAFENKKREMHTIIKETLPQALKL